MWFIGTGNFAALCLENLTKKNLKFSKIITGLPTRSGRNGKENPSPVELKAKELGLNAARTGKLNENNEILRELEENKPEIIFVTDFGQIIKEPFLSKICINIHPSLLPKYRGAAPIQRALLNGEKFTGVTAFRLVKAMDAGEILTQKEFQIPDNFNASDLYLKLSEIGCEITSEALKNELKFTPQDNSLATYAEKLSKEEFEVSFSMTAEKFVNTVRALDMSGGAYIIFNNKRVKVWRAKIYDNSETENPVFECSDNRKIEFCEVQSEGKKRMPGKDWVKGLKGLKI